MSIFYAFFRGLVILVCLIYIPLFLISKYTLIPFMMFYGNVTAPVWYELYLLGPIITVFLLIFFTAILCFLFEGIIALGSTTKNN